MPNTYQHNGYQGVPVELDGAVWHGNSIQGMKANVRLAERRRGG
jgi:hypothetical protein